MGGSTLLLVLFALGGSIAGAAIAWLIHAAMSRRRIAELKDRARAAIRDISYQRDELALKNSQLLSKAEALRAANARRKAKLKSVLKKANLLARNVLTLRDERENTKIKLSTLQNALTSLRQQSTALQTEFDKTREFYKRELMKSVERRKALEEDVKDARAEQEAFAKRMESSVLEHGSAENMVTAAQLRLGQLEVLQRNVNKLEAENDQLRLESRRLKQALDAQERDLAKLDELKLHNRQLVRTVEALESSRQEYEADAERFREQADQSEKESDTLRLKLEDLERNFADIEKQQNEALEDVRNDTVVPIMRKQR